MPDFIKSLADVKEDRCTILMVFYCLVYGVREAMALLYCRVQNDAVSFGTHYELHVGVNIGTCLTKGWKWNASKPR